MLSSGDDDVNVDDFAPDGDVDAMRGWPLRVCDVDVRVGDVATAMPLNGARIKRLEKPAICCCRFGVIGGKWVRRSFDS